MGAVEGGVGPISRVSGGPIGSRLVVRQMEARLSADFLRFSIFQGVGVAVKV